jgi:hypothetical protein
MSTDTFKKEGAANALVDEARSLTDQIRRTVAQSREITRAYKGVNQAIEAAILEIDMGPARNDDVAASRDHEREA